ncbi:MAG: T9SS type A sorting domain-containing protein [Flavobacteriales bacterium]
MNLKYVILVATAFSFLKAVAFSGTSRGFVENKGQLVDQSGNPNTKVKYYFRTKQLSVYLNDNGFSYELTKPTSQTEELLKTAFNTENTSNDKYAFLFNRVDFSFVNSPTTILKEDVSNSLLNFYTQTNPILDVKSFGKIVYKDVQPGIDVEFLVENGEFKYNILIHPEAKLKEFSFYIDGSREISVQNNELNIKTEFNEIQERIPLTYIQQANGTKEEIACNLNYNSAVGKVFFTIPESSNAANELIVIDPVPNVMWGTFMGGGNYDALTRMALDSNNNVLTVGMTMSSNNIATAGAHSTIAYGDLDGFVTKFDHQGNLLWATYYGNVGADRPYGIATDALRNVYIGGTTFSQMGIVTPGAYQTILESPDDAFIVKFDENGVRQWGTYYGGNGHEFVSNMTADAAGNVFFTGHTRSTNLIATAGTHKTTFSGTEIAFLTKFNTIGNLVWGTYFGGNVVDGGQSVRLDNAGNIILAGNARSTTGIANNMPQNMLYGYMDGFLAKFSSTGNIIWSRYVGGNFSDKILSVSVDEFNNIYAVGDTESTDSISTPGAFQVVRGSSEDGFLIKYNSNGNRLWGTYIGGSSSDYMHASGYINGKIFIGGNTDSANNIATPNSHQSTYAGLYDAFVMKFDASGTRDWGTYYGGAGGDGLIGVLPTSFNHIFIGGSSNSISGGIVHGSTPHQPSFGGGSNDGYLARLCEPISMFSQDTVYVCAGQPTLITATNSTAYEWSNGQTTASITYQEEFPGIDEVHVSGVDIHGCVTDTSFIVVVVNPAPPVPTLSFVNDTLFSSAPSDNLWYIDGNSTGNTNNYFVPTVNASYTVEVTNSFGCSSPSLPFAYIWQNILNNKLPEGFKLYPNPANEYIVLSYSPEYEVNRIRLLDLSGRLIKEIDVKQQLNQINILLNDVNSGVYFIEIQNSGIVYTAMFVVKH